MSKGYDSTSITVLQEELKMSRGAMYRYFESKDDLFKEVVDKYFFTLIRHLSPQFKEGSTLQEYINIRCQKMKEISVYLDQIEKFETAFLNYTAFIIQAAKVYPGFLERMKRHRDTELKNWQQAIENSIEKGEVRKDINVKIISLVFAKAIDMNDPEKPGPGCFSKTTDSTKKLMNYILSLIKA